ncbi:MAG: M23 family metallopeptidase [Clostridiales bacterium]|jgi:murein DD-endopeptidase MepM/ murein hydrolase activator NlpD|nr:M23 family metallopeptidase [Clostridiales bacterium]
MKIKNFFKKIGSFLKRNVYYVILFLCISGIATMIVLASINKTGAPGGNNNIIGNEDDDDDDVGGTPILFLVPVQDYQEGTAFEEVPVFSETLNDWRTHPAIDFKTDGAKEVYACFDGVVHDVYKNFFEGNVVIIKHNDELFSIYKSLSDDVRVQEGATVKKGDLIGYTSDNMNTEHKEGAHLHFEVEYKGDLIDPKSYFETGDK